MFESSISKFVSITEFKNDNIHSIWFTSGFSQFVFEFDINKLEHDILRFESGLSKFVFYVTEFKYDIIRRVRIWRLQVCIPHDRVLIRHNKVRICSFSKIVFYITKFDYDIIRFEFRVSNRNSELQDSLCNISTSYDISKTNFVCSIPIQKVLFLYLLNHLCNFALFPNIHKTLLAEHLRREMENFTTSRRRGGKYCGCCADEKPLLLVSWCFAGFSRNKP